MNTEKQSPLEELSAELHTIYMLEAERQAKELGRPVRHKQDYYELEEPTKEYDRVLARYILLREAKIKGRFSSQLSKLESALNMAKHFIRNNSDDCPELLSRIEEALSTLKEKSSEIKNI